MAVLPANSSDPPTPSQPSRWIRRNRPVLYAHLDRYAAGLADRPDCEARPGDRLRRHGGNAPPRTPHLHFTIFKLGADKRWWQGAPDQPVPGMGRAVNRGIAALPRSAHSRASPPRAAGDGPVYGPRRGRTFTAKVGSVLVMPGRPRDLGSAAATGRTSRDRGRPRKPRSARPGSGARPTPGACAR